MSKSPAKSFCFPVRHRALQWINAPSHPTSNIYFLIANLSELDTVKGNSRALEFSDRHLSQLLFIIYYLLLLLLFRTAFLSCSSIVTDQQPFPATAPIAARRCVTRLNLDPDLNGKI